MKKERALAALGMALVGVPVIVLGGVFYHALIVLLLAGAAWELAGMFRHQGMRISPPGMATAVATLLFARSFWPHYELDILAAWAMLYAAWYLRAYEQGAGQAASDLAAALGGVVYLGVLGGYLLDLRALPNGLWWFFFALPIVWVADSGAYLVGSRWGRRSLAPRLSPKKTWEGYWGGVVAGFLLALLLGAYYAASGRLTVSLGQAALLGLAVSMIAPLGDLTESLFKRQAGVKDSGRVFPGHGGFFDRIDSWLWAAALGYWIVNYLF